MSGSEGKALWREIERLPPWEVWCLFPHSRSIWSCCQLLVSLTLSSTVPTPCLSGSGSTILKTWLLPWTCPFQFLKVFSSPLVPHCTAGSSGQLLCLFFPLFLKKHDASFCLWLWSLAPYFSQPGVRELSPGLFWGCAHRTHPSCGEEAICPLNGKKIPSAATSGWKDRLLQAYH